MEKKFKKTYILNGLYLAQECLIKRSAPPFEVLLLNYNYQNIRIVTSWLVDLNTHKMVIQASGCDCGPQPSIRAGILTGTISWEDSQIRKALCSGEIGILNKKFCAELAEQRLIKEVFILKRPESEDEKRLFEKGIKRACRGKKVKPF